MAAPVCLHCERRPSVERLGLCAACHARPRIRVLYAVRRHGWTPAWEAHLRRLAERAKTGLPLFEDDLGEAAVETINDHRRIDDPPAPRRRGKVVPVPTEELVPSPETNGTS